jgi:hypothetical protein
MFYFCNVGIALRNDLCIKMYPLVATFADDAWAVGEVIPSLGIT